MVGVRTSLITRTWRGGPPCGSGTPGRPDAGVLACERLEVAGNRSRSAQPGLTSRGRACPRSRARSASRPPRSRRSGYPQVRQQVDLTDAELSAPRPWRAQQREAPPTRPTTRRRPHAGHALASSRGSSSSTSASTPTSTWPRRGPERRVHCRQQVRGEELGADPHPDLASPRSRSALSHARTCARASCLAGRGTASSRSSTMASASPACRLGEEVGPRRRDVEERPWQHGLPTAPSSALPRTAAAVMSCGGSLHQPHVVLVSLSLPVAEDRPRGADRAHHVARGIEEGGRDARPPRCCVRCGRRRTPLPDPGEVAR